MMRLAGTVLFVTLLSVVAVEAGDAYAQTGGESYPKRELLLFEDIPIVISASKLEQPITESPSSISIITAEDIRRSSATTIADLLRRVPGLDVLRISSSDAQVSARGFNESNNNDILLLIDGRSAYLDFFGIIVWDALPIVLEEIERIEIIRGPGSALYGANAFSGVINIITKTPEQAKGTTLSATVGEFDSLGWTFMNADVLGKWSYKVVAGWDAASSYDDRDRKDHEVVKGSALVQYEFDADSRIYFSAGGSDADGNTLTRTAPFDREGPLGYAKVNYDIGEWKLQAFVNVIDIDVLASDGEERSIINNAFDFDIQNSFEPTDDHNITWGANYRHNRITSHEIIGDNERQDLLSLFVQDQYRITGDMTLTSGVRIDSRSDTDTHLSPRASLVYEPWENHIFRASIARAFRNPSSIESFLDLNIGGVVQATGNEDLDSEEITSFELGYQTRLLDNRLEFKIDTFYNMLDEIIEFQRAPIPAIELEYINAGKADAYGGEVSLAYRMSDLVEGYLNYSYQKLKARDDGVQFQLNEDGDDIDSSPKHKINAGVYGELENGLNGSIDLNYVSEIDVGVFDAPAGFVPVVIPIDDYTRVDARIGYKFREPDIEVSLIVHNVFDDDHLEFPIGEVLQRQVFLQVIGRF
jgi:iron complex outermembrane receptor protein